MGGVLQADLAALGKLEPKVKEMVWNMSAKMPSRGAETPGADPAIVAMQSFMNDTLSDVHKAISGWMVAVAEVCAAFQHQLVETEEQGIRLFRSVPSPLHI
ncbi:MAG: hypothetical protein ACRDTI_23085 [Mycobacterium sp.]